MSGHSPGPWSVVQKNDDSMCDIATEVGTLREWTVASANKLREEYRANARLIAAAPELLEALKYALPSIAVANAYRKAELAIAKAEGKQ